MKKRKNILSVLFFSFLTAMVVLLILDTIQFCISNISIFLECGYISDDAWLTFWGSIIGSMVTLIGIVLTISHENKKSAEMRRLEAMPIIMLQESEGNEISQYKFARIDIGLSSNSDVDTVNLVKSKIVCKFL